MTNVAKLTGATTFWRNGYSGQGVDVALLDSGVLPVEGMLTPNKLVIGPDLSLESQSPTLEDLDTFGHGTHMAGIIAGRDSGTTSSTYATDNTHYLGMAPGSRIVSIKLADAQGNTDVSQVIAAIDWVVTHAQDTGMNIRVLNLSFGTDSTQDYRLDPLAHAAEVAWNSGIVVVVSAGNGGGTTTGLANPAYDPAVLAVGAVNTQGTADRTDDRVPAVLAARRDPRGQAGSRPGRARLLDRQPAGPGLLRRHHARRHRDAERPVLQGQRHLAGRGGRLRRQRAAALAAALAQPGPGQGHPAPLRRTTCRRPGSTPRATGLWTSTRPTATRAGTWRPPRCTPAAARWTRPVAPRRSRRTASR